jgi:hypothetical protein
MGVCKRYFIIHGWMSELTEKYPMDMFSEGTEEQN